jgi:hypothetical protein
LHNWNNKEKNVLICHNEKIQKALEC